MVNNAQSIVPAIEIKSEKYFDLVKSIDPTLMGTYRELKGHFFVFSPLAPGEYTVISPEELKEQYSEIGIGATVTTRTLIPKENNETFLHMRIPEDQDRGPYLHQRVTE